MFKKFFTLLIFSGLVLSAQSEAFSQTDNTLKVYKLSNGQTVVIKEVHANPIVTVDTWVKTGSINETVKNNGVSHFLEHLFFKGTTHYKAGEMDKILESKGAEFNAATSKDFTHFYTTIASQYYPTALKLQSDMLLNANIPPEELVKERKVVQEEIRRADDNPEAILFNNLNGLLFKHHPYKYETLGTPEMIGTIPRASIMSYYHKWYVPSNMVTVIVGDVTQQKALELVKEDFKYNNRNIKPISVKYTREPSLLHPAQKIQKGNYNTGYIMLGFKGVPVTDKRENHALDLAAAILGGGESSRLYQNIKEKQGLVTDISAGHYSMKDDSVFYISANYPPKNYELVKNSIMKEIATIRAGKISPEELQRAKTQFQREFLYSNESVENIANSVGYDMTIGGNIDYYTKYLDEINQLTIKDVQNAAEKYLTPSKVGVSILIPNNTAPVKCSNITPNTMSTAKIIKNQETFKSATKTELTNGITLITDKNTSNNIIALSIFVKGGQLVESIPGVNSIIASTLMKGTTNKSALEISKELENSGIIISPSSNSDYFEIKLKSTTKDFDKAFKLLTDIINNPTFNSEYIAKAQKDTLESINESRDVPASYGLEKLTRLLYSNHPYGNVGEVLEKSIPTITRNDVTTYYKQIFIPSNMVVSASGNINTDLLINKLYTAFPECKEGKKVTVESLKENFKPLPLNQYSLVSKDTSAAAIYLAWPANSVFNDKDFASLKVLSSILGNGMSSRLFVDLREKQGLAYTVSASYPTRIDDSFFALYIGTNPKNSQTVIKGFFDEINKIKATPVSEKELSAAKQKLLGQYAISQETNQDKAHILGAFETIDKGYKYNWQFIDLINSVNSGDIINAANKYFNMPYALSAIAPQTNIETIEKELKSESKR